VSSPDVVQIDVDSHPEWGGRRAVAPDGRLDMGSLGRLRVEGQTTAGIAGIVAAAARVPTPSVHVRMVNYNSQQIFLLGTVAGSQRAVDYRGSETVVDLLRRVGGLPEGAAADQVYVVRAQIGTGQGPRVFHVDLETILLRDDARTNIRLQPLDQVFVGETPEFSLARCVPPWLQPAFKAMCGIHRPEPGPVEKPAP
jgi:protein involved in polysaccharide export with SLBB domain